MQQRRRFVFFASAAVAADSSRITASSSASWSRFSPPSDFVNGHVSTMWFMVCRSLATITGRWLSETKFVQVHTTPMIRRRTSSRHHRSFPFMASCCSARQARRRLDRQLPSAADAATHARVSAPAVSTDSIRLITQSHKALRAGWAPVFGVCRFRFYIHTNIHIRH